MLCEILCPHRHAGQPFAAPVLGPVKGERGALDIARMGNGYEHLLIHDEIFHGHVLGINDDLGPSFISVFAFNFFKLLDDDRVQLFLVGEDPL